MAEISVTEITGTKKIIVLSLVGLVCILAIIAACIPDAREYAIKVVSAVLSAIPSLIK
jgi:hypothetical protein